MSWTTGALLGAILMAGAGAFKNLMNNSPIVTQSTEPTQSNKDIHSELIKYADLRDKGLISDVEFKGLKKKLLEK